MTALIEFDWHRDSAGYRIETRTRSTQGLLAAEDDEFVAVVENGGPSETYPLEDAPSLFAILAATEPTPDGVKSFAEKYGFLWKSEAGYTDPQKWEPYITTMRSVCGAFLEERYDDIAEAFNEIDDTDLSIRFDSVRGRSRPAMHLAPHDLISAIWLQIAQHVSNERELRQCLHCGTGFVFGSGTGRRRSGHYCSDRCRKAAWLASKEAS